MEDTGFIEAASGQCRTMADGTLRIVFDVEPRHAAEAFKLFSAPGTPAVLGRLRVPSAAPSEPERPQATKQRERLGPLCELAVKLCETKEFQTWAFLQPKRLTEDVHGLSMSEQAKAFVLESCGIKSRKQLDVESDAASRFHERVRKPYMAWLSNTQQAPA